MITLTITIPENKVAEVTTFVQKNGGEIKQNHTAFAAAKPETEEDEVTHESFFGENIKRVMRAFKS